MTMPRMQMHPRAPLFRVLSVLMALCFFNLEMQVLTRGEVVPQRAQAAGKVRRVGVFVLPDGGAMEGDAQVLQTLMRERVAGLAGVQLLTGSPEPNVNLYATVAPRIEEGAAALAAREPAAAARAYRDAYEKLTRHTGMLNRRLLARTVKGLGIAAALTGRIGKAHEMMIASLNLWPEQQPGEYAYSRDVIQTYRGAVRKMENTAAGGITVATTPEGAEVTVDGVARGVGPITVTDLAAGKHWVDVALDGYVRDATFVTVGSGETVGHRVVLEPRPNQDAWNTVMRQMPKAFRSKRTAKNVLPALVSILEADEVLVLRIRKGGRGYKLKGWHHTADGPTATRLVLKRDSSFMSNLHGFIAQTLGVSAEDEISPVLDAPPPEVLASQLDDDTAAEELFIDPNDPILKSAKRARARSITRQWWFWAAIGGTVAALGVGAVVLFSEGDEAKGPVGSVRLNFHEVGAD